MYGIIYWKNNDSLIDFIKNADGGVMIFNSVEEADAYANAHPLTDDMRVISLESVNE